MDYYKNLSIIRRMDVMTTCFGRRRGPADAACIQVAPTCSTSTWHRRNFRKTLVTLSISKY